MDLFISWSGENSNKIASVIRKWIPCVIQAVTPYYSPTDIEKGNRWNHEISKKLESSKVGIIILTQENLAAPWIMFEAGALAKNIEKSCVCPILFGVSPSDIQGPLLQFQCSSFTKEDVYKLIITINNNLEEKKLDDTTLSSTFEVWWEKLEKDIQEILTTTKGYTPTPTSNRSEKDILEELLRLARTAAYNHAWTEDDYSPFLFQGRKPVTFNPDTDVITFWDEKHRAIYDFTLERLESGAAVLDWFLQINGKRWCTPSHLKAFLDCLEELSDLHFNKNAQGLFCPAGDNKSVDWSQSIVKK